MIGFDTNVLLRVMLNDDPHQSRLAREQLLSVNEEKRGFVSVGVLLELFWVLERRYKLSRHIISDTLKKMSEVSSLEIENFDEFIVALDLYRNGNADFSDLLISEINKKNGCDFTWTFDKNAAENELGMELLV